MLQKEIPNTAEMELIGGAIAKQCPPGARLFLQGQLGAGKTTLVRGFLRELGYQGIVKSPTYTLVEPYFLPGITIYHFDLYRLNNPAELEAIGLRDYYDPAVICLIEWPEKASELLGNPDVDIKIEHHPAGRMVYFAAQSPAGKTAIQSLS